MAPLHPEYAAILVASSEYYHCYWVILYWSYFFLTLTYRCGDRDLGQLYLRYSLVAWRHQSLTCTNFDSSAAKSSKNNLLEISPDHSINYYDINSKYIYQQFHRNPKGKNELMCCDYVINDVLILNVEHKWCIYIYMYIYIYMPYDVIIRLDTSFNSLCLS